MKPIFQEISKEEYLKSYNFHKKDYWKRKLNSDFDYELLTGVTDGEIDKAINVFEKNVDTVNLETSSYCNRKCDYCPVSTYGRNFKTFINQKLFKNIILSLKKINFSRNICLNLYNEPLADKNFTSYLKFIRENLPLSILQSNSNGDFIKKLNDLHKLEASGLNKLKITLHVPKGKKFSQADSRQSLIKFAKRINFQLNSKHISELGFCFRVNKLFVIVQCPNWFDEGNYRGGTINTTKTYKNRVSPCVKPFREFTVYYNGNVTPCCDIFNNNNFNKHVIQSVDKNDSNSIFKIYAYKKLSQWRKHLFGWNSKKDPCASCSSSIDNLNQKDTESREQILNNVS